MACRSLRRPGGSGAALERGGRGRGGGRRNFLDVEAAPRHVIQWVRQFTVPIAFVQNILLPVPDSCAHSILRYDACRGSLAVGCGNSMKLDHGILAVGCVSCLFVFAWKCGHSSAYPLPDSSWSVSAFHLRSTRIIGLPGRRPQDLSPHSGLLTCTYVSPRGLWTFPAIFYVNVDLAAVWQSCSVRADCVRSSTSASVVSFRTRRTTFFARSSQRDHTD